MAHALCIVGAGPAGAGVAAELIAAGHRPVVLDENRRAGGNIFRRRSDSPPAGLERGTEFHPQAEVLAVGADRTVYWQTDGELHERGFDAVFLCTGAYDLVHPRPGVDLPSVSTAGALQALLKGQGLVPSGPVVVVGGGPFLYIVASDLLRAGARVTHLVDRVSTMGYARLLASAWGRMDQAFTFAGALMRLRRNGVRIVRGREIVRLDPAVAMLDDGARLPFWRIAISDLFASQTQLARSAGCDLAFTEPGHYWAVATDPLGRTSVPGIHVAGEGQGVRGAPFADVSGRLAARAFLADQGDSSPAAIDTLLARRAKLEGFATALERVSQAYPPAFDDEAAICACERVSVASVRAAVRGGLEDLSSIKIVTRAGMGSCQGRYCEPHLARLIRTETGRPPRAPFTQNGLVRPVRAADLAHG